MSQLELFAGRGAARVEVDEARVAPGIAALARRLPDGLRIGTSSWSFPGWAGLVYGASYPERTLARAGLAAYARHPLLGAVGLDRSFYAPLDEGAYRNLAVSVPPGFRFVVKAYAGVTMPEAQRARHGYLRHPPDADPFLDPAFARRHVVEPMVAGLGENAGALVFQFPPLPASLTRQPARFCERLHRFLQGLPRGPVYAVEIRNGELLNADYADALRAAGAVHAFSIHPRMPSLADQREACGRLLPGAPLVVRWMLGGGQTYEAARVRYAPFARLVDPDPGTRSAIAAEVLAATRVGSSALVIVNNKAEGSAPLSIIELARELDRRSA